jgi:hypothetical protein
MADRADAERDEMLRHQYDQVCTSYRAIDDFRGRLLALWPILGGAAGGVALLALRGTSDGYLVAIGLLGAAVSTGVAVYEWHQTLRCDLLKKTARRLERKMGFEIGEGQFLSLPRGFELSATGPSVPQLERRIGQEEREGRGEMTPTYWGSICESPIRVGVASLIVYGSVIVGWLGLFVWGSLRLVLREFLRLI